MKVVLSRHPVQFHDHPREEGRGGREGGGEKERGREREGGEREWAGRVRGRPHTTRMCGFEPTQV